MYFQSPRIPLDNTIPQITEGAQVLTASITPQSATSMIEVEAIMWAGLNANHWVVGAIFRSDDPDAIVAQPTYIPTTGGANTIVLRNRFVAGSTSPLEISLRAGPVAGYTAVINGSVSALMGGAGITSLYVREVL